MSQKNHSFNVLLDDQTLQRLKALAAANDISAGAVVRQAINARHAMQIRQIPCCANGRNCMCPHFHIVPGRQVSIETDDTAAAPRNTLYPAAEETIHGA